MKKFIYIIKNLRIFSSLKWFYLKTFTSRDTSTFNVLGHDMILDLKTGGISRALAMYGSREIDMLEIVRDIIEPGMNIFDLGANIGFYTLEMNRLLSGKGKILAVEPDPRNIPLLKKNLKNSINPDIVALFEGAVGEHDGVGYVSMASKSNLTTVSSQSNNGTEIKLRSIDSLANEFLEGKINLVRMDIEGYEVEVLGGAIEFFKHQENCNILVEVHPNTYNDNHSFSRVLKEYFNNGFIVKKAVCTSIGMNILNKNSIITDKEIYSDGFERYFFSNLSNTNACNLVEHQPKAVRYILLSK